MNDEKRKVRRLLNEIEMAPGCLESPRYTRLDNPFFHSRFRILVNSRPVSIISGGHLLAEGNWEWKFERKSHIPSQITAYKTTRLESEDY